MDIVLKTKKREISLILPLFVIFIGIPTFLIGLVIILFENFVGLAVWIDLFDGGKFDYLITLQGHSQFIIWFAVIKSLLFPIITLGFILYWTKKWTKKGGLNSSHS